MSSFDAIRDLLVEKFQISADEIRLEATLEDLGLDSLSVVELLFDLEDLFGIELPQEEAQGLVTLGDAVEAVDRRRRQADG